MTIPESQYKIFAIKYASHERRSGDNFIGGDSHDISMPLDYFVWAVVGESNTYLVDTGFDAEMAARRGRQITHPVEEGLRQIGIEAGDVEHVIITHMHYDHAGNPELFPRARYYLQDREMAYCTGRCMCHRALNHPFEVADVKAMVGRVFEGRAQFHDGDSVIAPGLSVHRVGGHTDGLQVVRVNTQRGGVVLASDASHFYANIQQGRPYPIVHNVGDMLEGFAIVDRLADSADHIIPGHDPDVLERFPPHSEPTRGWIARLDLDPVQANHE
ncbi:N-acyl homoserine lactonase family protein [Paraburkholderia xenovorans]